MNLMFIRVMNVSIIEEKTTLPADAGCVFFCNVAAFISHRNHQESILLFKEEYILESFPKDVLRQHTLPQKSKETIALIVK